MTETTGTFINRPSAGQTTGFKVCLLVNLAQEEVAFTFRAEVSIQNTPGPLDDLGVSVT
jgi:hypothetical protein